MFFAILLSLAATLGLAAPTAAQQGEYRLQPGDRLEMSMPGLLPDSWQATIDMTGQAHFPFLGGIKAGGMTLSELGNEVVISGTGLEVPIFSAGRRSTAVLSGDDIFVQVVRYRPITVLGDVTQPGPLEYAPGLTVRAALGAAGGVRLMDPSLSRVPADATVRLQTALQTQRWLRAQVMRADILLGAPDGTAGLTEPQKQALFELLGEAEGQTATDEISLILTDRVNTAQDLIDRIDLAKNRVGNLQKALENYEASSRVEEERLQRLLSMEDRGLITSASLDTARNAALQASTRLLTVSSDIYEAEAELGQLQQSLARLNDGYQADALEEKRRFEQQLAEVSAQISSLRLLLLSEDTGATDQTEIRTEILIHRKTGAEEETLTAELGDTLWPGDEVEVVISVLGLEN